MFGAIEKCIWWILKITTEIQLSDTKRRLNPTTRNQKKNNMNKFHCVCPKNSANVPQAKRTDFAFLGTRVTGADETKTTPIKFFEDSNNPHTENDRIKRSKIETFGGPKRSWKQTQQTSKHFVLPEHDYADSESRKPWPTQSFRGGSGLKTRKNLPTRSQKE